MTGNLEIRARRQFHIPTTDLTLLNIAMIFSNFLYEESLQDRPRGKKHWLTQWLISEGIRHLLNKAAVPQTSESGLLVATVSLHRSQF